jgi:WD repeat and SOF domain-containing protein 1
MKVRALQRDTAEYCKETTADVAKVNRNPDPLLHPFERAREVTRALNAVKLQRVFAKPFVHSLEAHTDGVYRLVRHPRQITTLASASCDGEIRLWDLSNRKCVHTISAHKGFVRGVAFSSQADNVLFSAGDDRLVKRWSLPTSSSDEDPPPLEPTMTYVGKLAFSALDHQRRGRAVFATSGSAGIDVWEENRAEPLHSFAWGVDPVVTVKFNPVEHELLASAATDRNIVLYDLRTTSPLKKLVMNMRTNAIEWNPMEAFNFTTASEDHNLYTFDMRKLDRALQVHSDHVAAVLDLNYSPTGQEFVSGSYDRTLRIFPVTEGRSRELYHTKRMQRLFAVSFSGDAQYVVSGSDDTNIRLWKADASKPVKIMHPREKAKLEYKEALIERYKDVPEIKRIARHRHVPKPIMNAQRTRAEMKRAVVRKEERRRKHSKKYDANPYPVERKKHLVAVEQ